MAQIIPGIYANQNKGGVSPRTGMLSFYTACSGCLISRSECQNIGPLTSNKDGWLWFDKLVFNLSTEMNSVPCDLCFKMFLFPLAMCPCAMIGMWSLIFSVFQDVPISNRTITSKTGKTVAGITNLGRIKEYSFIMSGERTQIPQKVGVFTCSRYLDRSGCQ